MASVTEIGPFWGLLSLSPAPPICGSWREHGSFSPPAADAPILASWRSAADGTLECCWRATGK